MHVFNIGLKKLAIIGAGGLAREIACNLKKKSFDLFTHRELIKKYNLLNFKCVEDLDTSKYSVLLALGDPFMRIKIMNELPGNTDYFTYIDKQAKLFDVGTIKIGKGNIITSGCILTTNINMGHFNLFNIGTNVSHDTTIGNFNTTSPGVNISGNVTIGNNCYFGSGCTLRNKIRICDNVTIGMNGAVVKDICESGTYVGIPAKKLK